MNTTTQVIPKPAPVPPPEIATRLLLTLLGSVPKMSFFALVQAMRLPDTTVAVRLAELIDEGKVVRLNNDKYVPRTSPECYYSLARPVPGEPPKRRPRHLLINVPLSGYEMAVILASLRRCAKLPALVSQPEPDEYWLASRVLEIQMQDAGMVESVRGTQG